jgi:hypothetical protein
MAQSFRFICNSCGETIESWDEGDPYYLDERGRKQYAYHPDSKRDQCIGIDSPYLCRDVFGRFPIPRRPMPELFLHLNLRHLRLGKQELSLLPKGHFRAAKCTL